MKLTFTPMRRDDTLSVSVAGDVLSLNGTEFDLSGIPEGATLPRAAVTCDWLASDIERIGGALHLALILPHGDHAPHETLFPTSINVTTDGPVALPPTASQRTRYEYHRPDQLITAEEKSTAARAARHADLAELRWQQKTGGLTLPDGRSVMTTRESQAQIAGVVQSINAGLISEPIDWKLASGWAELSAQDVQDLARAVTTYVKTCFATERREADWLAAQLGDVSAADLRAAFQTALSELA